MIWVERFLIFSLFFFAVAEEKKKKKIIILRFVCEKDKKGQQKDKSTQRPALQ